MVCLSHSFSVPVVIFSHTFSFLNVISITHTQHFSSSPYFSLPSPFPPTPLLGGALLHSPHHPQGALHLHQPTQHLLSDGPQCRGDGGLLLGPMSAESPALPGPATAARQQPREPLLPRGERPQPELHPGVLLHAQGLLLRTLPWIPGGGIGREEYFWDDLEALFVSLREKYFVVICVSYVSPLPVHSSHPSLSADHSHRPGGLRRELQAPPVRHWSVAPADLPIDGNKSHSIIKSFSFTS